MKQVLCLLLLAALLCGCGGEAPPASEHDAGAAMAHVPEITLYLPDGAGGLIAEAKRLPVEAHMADAVLALFPQAVFASAKCRVADGAAAVDITGFAAQDNAVKERAALSSVVNTLLELPDIHAVSVTFDGERQKALPHGTAVWEAFQEPLDVLPAPTITPSPLP